MSQPGAAGEMVIQIFGRNDSRSTRRALRFFKERRMPIAFVDLAKRPPAPGELRRFSQRFGAAALMDTESKAYKKADLGYLRMNEAEITQRLLADPRLLKLPLVRNGNELTVGVDEATWRDWQKRGQAGA
jgi:arsenate reductase-like glutaredoxin family protein